MKKKLYTNNSASMRPSSADAAPKIENHPWLPKDPIDAVIRGCVSALVRGTYDEERDIWKKMFITLGAKDDAEVDKIVDTVCRPIADQAIMDEMTYFNNA